MSREILFKAKRTDNGEWVIGLPTVMWGQQHIMPMDNENKAYPYDPETLCQYTGFSDEDGNKIFDGDIVGFLDYTSTENGYCEHGCRGQVVWDEETASFQVTERLSAESYEVLDRGCKVLGNIFDNPELLEQEV